MEKIIHCVNCIHRPLVKCDNLGKSIIQAPHFPNGNEDLTCPFIYNSQMPSNHFFCKYGEEAKPKVGIYNFKMPEICIECPCYDDSGDYPTCILTHYSAGYNFNARIKRMDLCPLRELKGD